MSVVLAVEASLEWIPQCLHHGAVVLQVPMLYALAFVLDAWPSTAPIAGKQDSG